MQTENPVPNFMPEFSPKPTELAVDRLPNVPDSEPALEKGAEKFEKTADLSAIATDVGIATAIPTTVNQTTDDTVSVTITGVPMVAGDDDLIEKEWVDRAKKIVVDTKNDPHKREYEVSKLQSEYIEKRYGRKLGAVE